MPSSASSPLPQIAVPRAIVAIPVRNERERIVACLDALARQISLSAEDFGIVLFLNNCTDGTAAVVRSFNMPWPIRVIERDDPAASAGWARRIAMEAASNWLAEAPAFGGVLLTSDADSRVAPDWVVRNLAAIEAGADLVAGRIALDPDEAALLPERLLARGRLEAEYERMLIEIEARLDPQPGDAWPCHWSNSGATIAVRHSTYLAVGGMPDMATGEDRAFVDAVRGNEFVVRHDCDIVVVTSGRLDGRAVGGVADTIKLRCDQPESPCDDRMEAVNRLVFRTLWRRQLWWLHRRGRLGSLHGEIEALRFRLPYQPVRPSDLPRQIRRAARALWALRLVESWKTKPKLSYDIPTTSVRIVEHQLTLKQKADAL